MNDNRMYVVITFILAAAFVSLIIVPTALHYHMRAQQVAKSSDLGLRVESCIQHGGASDSSIHWCEENIK